MPQCRFDDWSRWISSVGVLCLLGLPGMFFPSAEAAGDERAVTPDTVPPVEAPASENPSETEDEDEKGINPHVIMAAVKHDQLVPRRVAAEDERPRVRPVSRRDTGTLDPDADQLNADERPLPAGVLAGYVYEFVGVGARVAQLPPSQVMHCPSDPAIGTAVCSLAPPCA